MDRLPIYTSRCMRLRSYLLSFLLLALTSSLAAHPGDGVLVDEEGNIYFASVEPLDFPTGQHYAALWRLTGEGSLELVFRSQHNPSNLYTVLGLDGRVYCQERHFLGEAINDFDSSLWRIEEDGSRTHLLGPTRGRRPYGGAAYAVDGEGSIYYADDYLIKKRSRDGSEVILAGSTQGARDGRGVEAQFTHVDNLVWGPGGELYVLDRYAIRVLSMDGTVSTLVRGLDQHQLDQLAGNRIFFFDLAVDAERSAYLADWGNRRVLRVSAGGAVKTILHNEDNWSPEGLAVSDAGLVLYETTGPFRDKILPRIRLLKPSGKLKTLYEYRESESE